LLQTKRLRQKIRKRAQRNMKIKTRALSCENKRRELPRFFCSALVDLPRVFFASYATPAIIARQCSFYRLIAPFLAHGTKFEVIKHEPCDTIRMRHEITSFAPHNFVLLECSIVTLTSGTAHLRLASKASAANGIDTGKGSGRRLLMNCWSLVARCFNQVSEQPATSNRSKLDRRRLSIGLSEIPLLTFAG